ncbi:hypothetical protein LAC81_30365 [Ensifer adhaerens]|uniref:KGGVGR-motif variant AAA ATPase n=1 Tax=Ensifer adhaerens TaxID=106592 RepID=UPI001CBCAFDE|nr:hypothetical protein [Ensifer adhaerens]MBZ7925046.1 hypothetical protein [Ensifer adhaerens]UAX95760.1 hypothetical protein LAC78_33465 [Ensifer adhaerens]UAY04899.1 hypothetical protein LAC80_26845 [Ensifer adhaerens]UAY10331.1 hypothetical protein LAC81_30365 [Ensifer adhaerens]
MAEGRIITFYSFKGGVGRTMALANTAFLAALNGHRVLVMDWDLEAPGLAYYFRGLMEGADLKSLKESPGILNLMWDWSRSVADSKTAQHLDNVISDYESGAEFSQLVRTILDPADGVLDYIGAGSPIIETPEAKSYEDALAHFSWPSFFNECAGGILLQALRDWAKSSYDYVFIDSRTGMADVAGICTMQIPDTVALCFILNRQNIDGVAKVAAAIRTRREERIELRAVPMRAVGVGASLESDATARALLQLSKIGGFSPDAVQEDFRSLSVNAAQDLPYYETLAPFVAQDPALDYLTLNYLRLASQLLNVPLEIPSFDPDWLAAVHRRLRPTHATVEYVNKLKGAEPSRAVSELLRLIDSACEDELDGAELEDEYVSALVDAALGLTDYSDSPFAAVELLNRTVDLLRSLMTAQPMKWKHALTWAIERYLAELNFYMEPSEELALLEELDGLLATATTVNARLRRISNRRRVARIYLNENEVDAASQTVGDLSKLIKDFREFSVAARISPEQQEEIVVGDVDISLLRGEIYQAHVQPEKSVREFLGGLQKIEAAPMNFRTELLRLQYDLHSRLARTSSDVVGIENAAEHALQAVRAVSWSGGTNALVVHFVDLANAVLAPRDAGLVLKFLEAVFGDERRGQAQFANYYGRHQRTATPFLKILTKCAKQLVRLDDARVQSLLRHMAAIANLVYANLERKKHTIGEKALNEVREHLLDLGEIVQEVGVPFDFIFSLKPRRPRSQ